MDSPVALAAWLLDHDTDSYHKISRAFLDRQASGRLTREQIVDNITLYWLTGTGADESEAVSLCSLLAECAREARHQALEPVWAAGMVALAGGSWGHGERGGPLEFGQAAERRGVRPGRVEKLDEDFCDRPKRFNGRVDQAGVDAVASGEEPVLGEHLFGGAGLL